MIFLCFFHLWMGFRFIAGFDVDFIGFARCCLESVAVSAGVLGADTVLCLLCKAIHAGNTKNKNAESIKGLIISLISYPAPSIMFLRLQ